MRLIVSDARSPQSQRAQQPAGPAACFGTKATRHGVARCSCLEQLFWPGG